jgi:hypothetical protein
LGDILVLTLTKAKKAATLEPLAAVSPWPNANARLLGLGVGLPVKPLDRLAQFSAAEFERFTLEWASDYLSKQIGVFEVQQRGGAGDKGRDVVVWLDASSVIPRRWHLYQCKHYSTRLGTGVAATEIGKVLHYTSIGDYAPPEEYWFVTHLGVTGDLQDHLDDPEKLRAFVLDNWDDYCADKITSKVKIELGPELRKHVEAFDFSIFRAKQPQAILDEHAQTRFHLTVFGAPLIDRPPPPAPPSSVAPGEVGYVSQLYRVIGGALGISVTQEADFAHALAHRKLFERSRITFYCAENLKELARDQMADAEFFNTLLDEFSDGLYHTYTGMPAGLARLKSTIQAAQAMELGGHVLQPHVKANDREGICHQLANDDRVQWCEP